MCHCYEYLFMSQLSNTDIFYSLVQRFRCYKHYPSCPGVTYRDSNPKKDLTFPSTGNANFFGTFNFMLRKLPLLCAYFISSLKSLNGEKVLMHEYFFCNNNFLRNKKVVFFSWSSAVALGGQRGM